jgi:hypothetical protein
VTITKADIFALKEKQNGRCALSGVKLKWKPKSGWKKASVDRIDNNKGYTPDNIRLVAWGVNQALSDNDYEDFIKMCHKLAQNNPRVYVKKEKPEIVSPKTFPEPEKVIRKPRPHKRKYPNGNKCLDCQKLIYHTSTRCGSCSSKFHNKRKVQDRPSKEILREFLKENSYCAAGRKWGVSDNAIRKWLK